VGENNKICKFAQSSKVAVSGGQKIMACGRSYFIADTTVRNHILAFNHQSNKIIIVKETVTDTTSLCNSMNMTVLTFETIAEIFCLINMIPIGASFFLYKFTAKLTKKPY
jgi:hypothetical protein